MRRAVSEFRPSPFPSFPFTILLAFFLRLSYGLVVPALLCERERRLRSGVVLAKGLTVAVGLQIVHSLFEILPVRPFMHRYAALLALT